MLHDQQLTETSIRLVAAELGYLAHRMEHQSEDSIRRLICQHCDDTHYGHRPGDIKAIRAKARGNVEALTAELVRYARTRNVTIPMED